MDLLRRLECDGMFHFVDLNIYVFNKDNDTYDVSESCQYGEESGFTIHYFREFSTVKRFLKDKYNIDVI